MTNEIAGAPSGAEITPGRLVHHSELAAVSLGSLGVVYGDIGTSPLYAFREAIAAAGGTAERVSTDAVLGTPRFATHHRRRDA